MKKIVMLVVALAGGLLIYRRLQAAQAEEDLWIEATSAVEPEPVA
ncbi:MAG: hypothetical protein QOD72_1872 [Acidimicrobiaceae bacterium]|jgi:hypothetical protein|nr:hypothetical protein [Acidimicrobiaceae bacterium]MEA3035458.1 hypothetical protein [Sphingomonadales bacterium]